VPVAPPREPGLAFTAGRVLPFEHTFAARCPESVRKRFPRLEWGQGTGEGRQKAPEGDPGPPRSYFEAVTRSNPLRLVEIAELLGVSKQRANQIADESDFPAPVAEDGRGQLWNRRDVAMWAKDWRIAKPWR
jgi:hypothetical protein